MRMFQKHKRLRHKKIGMVVSIIALSMLVQVPCDAFEWKDLHERADATTSAQARRAVREHARSIEAWYLLGLVYLNEYKNADARMAFENMLALEPDSVEGAWGRAETLRRDHQSQESQEVLESLIGNNPTYYPAYLTLAYIKYLQMDFNEAVRLTTTIIDAGLGKVDKTNLVRAYGLYSGAKGMIAHYGGPLSKVINGPAVMANLKKAAALDPASPVVLFGFGSYYMLVPPLFGRDLDKAEGYLKQAIAKDPNFVEAYVRLAQAYKMKGEERLFDQYLQKALLLDPRNELARDIKNEECKFICVD